MIKNILIELLFFVLLVFLILSNNNIDNGVYKFFSQMNYGSGVNHLEVFFINITELGNSLWYFLILFFIFLISFLAKKNNLITTRKYSYFKNFSIFSFLYLLSTGVVTQAVKHLIGRTRPNHINLDEIVHFNFFTIESAFHSFPSGHTSTIIAVTLIFCLAIPSLKFFLLISGSIIAISRVVVGAHYFTDVIAGTLVAIIVYKALKVLYNNLFPKVNFDDFKIMPMTTVLRIQIVFIIIAIFLTIGPSMDIYISSLFYYGNNQFLLQSNDIISIIFRKILLPFLIVYIFILPTISKFFFIQKIFFNYKFSIKEVLFIWFSGLITIILFVNLLFKNMWGRSRPNDIYEFGGLDSFDPWYKFGDLCESNCSFVSGDSSIGFLLILFFFITKKNIYCYLAIIFGSSLGFIRIIAGGHFFSDIIFAQLIVTISVSILFIIYRKLYAK